MLLASASKRALQACPGGKKRIKSSGRAVPFALAGRRAYNKSAAAAAVAQRGRLGLVIPHDDVASVDVGLVHLPDGAAGVPLARKFDDAEPARPAIADLAWNTKARLSNE